MVGLAKETRSTCPYCAVGCGVLIYTIGDNAKNVTPQVIHVEGLLIIRIANRCEGPAWIGGRTTNEFDYFVVKTMRSNTFWTVPGVKTSSNLRLLALYEHQKA